MKWIISLMMFSVGSKPLATLAQNDSSGIYLSGEDFKSNKITYAINCKTESHKIKLNDFLGKSYITVIHNDSAYKLLKAGIFGFKTCEGQIVRFLGKKELILLNPSESILIYKNEVTHPAIGKTNVTNYYFSKDAISDVRRLTIKNVKKTFSDNLLFLQKIDSLFNYNTELAAYDELHKTYMINRALQSSKLN